MVSLGSPPYPHPWRQQKSPVRGQTYYKKMFLLMISIIFYEKGQKYRPPVGLKMKNKLFASEI
jgi:hypothetical protein